MYQKKPQYVPKKTPKYKKTQNVPKKPRTPLPGFLVHFGVFSYNLAGGGGGSVHFAPEWGFFGIHHLENIGTSNYTNFS